MTFLEGTRFLLLMTLLMGGIIMWTYERARSGKMVPTLRRINGLDAVEEAVGRATEMGRPIHYCPGLADVTAQTAPQTFAALEILGFVTELTARYNTTLVVTISSPNVFPLAQEIVRQRYQASGRPDMFQENTVRFLSSAQFAYAAGVMGIFFREKVAANVMIGAFWAESLLLAEAGAQNQAIQVAGTAAINQIPFFVAACDYTLIGEEIYAASAYLSQNKPKLGAIAGQDYCKALVLAFVIAGILFAVANSSALLDLTRF